MSEHRRAPLRGLGLVMVLEFRMRLRTRHWPWLMVAWALLVFGFMLLIDLRIEADNTAARGIRGVPDFGILMLCVLGMMLVISPTLTAQAINGDRERGTLATLQVTRLRPVEIALGKLLAGWAVGLVALGLTLPAVGYAFYRGGLTVAHVAGCYLVVALLIGVVCAISQAFSALFSRTVTSGLLSYLAVSMLAFGTLGAFTLAESFAQEEVVIDTPTGPASFQRVETERIWWLVAPNPFAIVADAAPSVPPRAILVDGQLRVVDDDPLSSISTSVRDLRNRARYYNGYFYYSSGPQPAHPAAVWPWGLGFDLLVGVGAAVVSTLRLRAPARRLARGVRLA